MKKALRIVVALAVVLCLTTMSVFAASSKTFTVEQKGATDASGNAVTVTAATSAETLAPDKAAQIIASSGVKADDLTVAYVQDISVPEGTKFPLKINFSISGVTDDQTVYIFHFNGTAWELVGNGKGSNVSASFNSLSPVAIVVEKAATSYKTGETDMPMFAFAAIVVAGAAACMLYKRKTVA